RTVSVRKRQGNLPFYFAPSLHTILRMSHMQTYKLDSLTMAWPTDWTVLFGTSRPLILEIGFGQGTFLFHLARKYPEANIIGLEISNQCLVKAENTLQREQVANVRVIHSRAETALNHLFEP